METGAVDSNATYSYSAKPLNYIDYRYEVQSGDRTDSLDYQNMYTHRIGLDDSFENTIACKLPLNSAGHGRIRQNYDIVVDGTPPEVESVSSPNASRTYGAGETIAVNVTFTKDVEVNTTSGRPLVLMETGATDRNATYARAQVLPLAWRLRRAVEGRGGGGGGGGGAPAPAIPAALRGGRRRRRRRRCRAGRPYPSWTGEERGAIARAGPWEETKPLSIK